MEEKRSFKEVTKEKFEVVKWKVKDGINESVNWIGNHKTEIVLMTPMVISAFGFAGNGIKYAKKHMEIRHETRKRDLQIYDPSTGCYLYLKRPLRTSEKVALANRTYGTTVTQCLDDLNVLK